MSAGATLMKWGNWLIGACCALFVAVIVTPTGVYEGVWKLAKGDNAADWAQFFGTMIALAVTFIAANIPIWAARRQEAQRLASLDAAAQRMLNNAHLMSRAVADQIEGLGEGQRNLQRAAYRLATIVDALERFPTYSLHDQSSPLSLAMRLGEAAKVIRDAMHRVQALAHGQRDKLWEVAAGENMEVILTHTVRVTAALAKGEDPYSPQDPSTPTRPPYWP